MLGQSLKKVWQNKPPDLFVQYEAPVPLRQWWWKGALLFLLLLLLGGGALYYTRNPPHSLLTILSTTPPGVPTATSTTNVPTATSTTGVPTATPTTNIPIQTPSPVPTGPPQSGSVIPAGWHQMFNESLTENDPQSLWTVTAPTADPSCQFTGSYYEENASNLEVCTRGNSTSNGFTDLSYAIDVSIHQGTLGGLVVRKSNNSYYYFTITITGEYALLFHSSANGGVDTTIVQSNSGAIHQGVDQWNTILLVVQGSSFKLYINGQSITAVSDGTKPSGEIAVVANNSDVRFKNAIVYVP